jgi:integrase
MNNVRDTEDEPLIVLAGGVGLRAGEMAGLQWTDIDEEMNIIRIRRSRYRYEGQTGNKTPKRVKSIRDIPVDPYIIEILCNHPNDSEYVLCRSTGEPYRNDELYHWFMDILEKYNMPHTRLHDLRHYNATMLAYYGVDLKTVSEMLGDTPEMILKVYQHSLDKAKREAAKKMGSIFRKNCKLKNDSVS